MSIRTWVFRLTGALGALALLAPSQAMAADAYRVARVSDVSGNLAVRGENEDSPSYVERNAVLREGDTIWAGESTRAEFELERGSWVRLAEQTKVDLYRLSPSAEFRLWTGSIYLDLSDRLTNPVFLRTPSGDVVVEPDSVVRVDLKGEESARVSVYSGRARVTPDDGGALRLSAGDRTYLDNNGGAEPPRTFDRGDLDTFDRYHRERVDYYIRRPLPRELGDRADDIVGARDLRDYGSWVEVDRVSYWRPRCEPDWRPYSAGYWSYVPGCGYTWIDYAPWGYTTCHYGRWTHRTGYGWLWYPGYVWAPAYVSWSSYGSYCGWAPLDPWDRPCYTGFGGGFSSGGLFIGFSSWSFCHRDQFFYGLHHRRYTHEGRGGFLTGNQIRGGHESFRLIGDVHREIGVPRDRVRGLTVGADGRSVRDRVMAVEAGLTSSRLKSVESHFRVPGNRDRGIKASPVEGLQRNPGGAGSIQTRIIRGDEAVRGTRQLPDRKPDAGREGGTRLPDRRPEDGTGRLPDRRPDTPANPTRPLPDRRPDNPGVGGDRQPDRRPDSPTRPGDARPLPDRKPDVPTRDRDEDFRRGPDRRPDNPTSPGQPTRPAPERRPDNPGVGDRQPDRRPDNPTRPAPERRPDNPGVGDRQPDRRPDNPTRPAPERKPDNPGVGDRQPDRRPDNPTRPQPERKGFDLPGAGSAGDRDGGFRRGGTEPGFRDFPSRGGSGGDYRDVPSRGGEPRPSDRGPSYRDFPGPSRPAPDRSGGYSGGGQDRRPVDRGPVITPPSRGGQERPSDRGSYGGGSSRGPAPERGSGGVSRDRGSSDRSGGSGGGSPSRSGGGDRGDRGSSGRSSGGSGGGGLMRR